MTDDATTLREASAAPVDLTSSQYWGGLWARSEAARSKPGFSRRKFIGRATDDLLVSLIDRVAPEPADVLELGCAPGWKLERLGRQRPQHRYHGLDYATEGVEITRQYHRRCGFNSTIHLGDLRTFEPARKYDVVYSCGLVEHFTDPLPILRNHARLCRSGGHVVITLPNFNVPIVRWFIRRLAPELLVTHNFQLMDPGVAESFMKDAGLSEVRVGKGGHAKICSECTAVTPVRAVYRTLARAWNFFSVACCLSFPWQDAIWAVGATLAAQDDDSPATARRADHDRTE